MSEESVRVINNEIGKIDIQIDRLDKEDSKRNKGVSDRDELRVELTRRKTALQSDLVKVTPSEL